MSASMVGDGAVFFAHRRFRWYRAFYILVGPCLSDMILPPLRGGLNEVVD